MVRVMGLEPIRQRHTPLKRACLPIPAHSQTKYSIMLLRTVLDNDTYYSTIILTCQCFFEIYFVKIKIRRN